MLSRGWASPRGIAGMVSVVVVGVLLLAGCGVDGTPTREMPKEPLHCSIADCPELPVFSSKRLAESGVTDANASTAVPQYLGDVLDDLDAVWQDWFAALNIEEATAGRVLIRSGNSFVSDCLREELPNGIPSDFPNAFFCPRDNQQDGAGADRQGSVILPVDTFADIWNGKLMGSDGFLLGDFSAATIVAHEYGHNVVYRLAKAYGLDTGPAGDNSELIADCFAGNWAATVFERKDLSFKEMLQAAALMISIGDAKEGQGHGTSVQRALALWRGFSDNLKRQGQPVDCLKQYWPRVLAGS
ncbi:neutral zinc metallopeptidase [Gordonia hydrophobica]|uniref:Neutral zinc metallopeptidase n=1 Tax=Gordonia hydrophobica TaxID=40516 RepID=A0ABZ2U455_9ACTN|nr:neutral zinc metallopeptidase [Gordonia hydrophobica]MBM7366657.1 putative metalloprotease [Gordonia hydrophobica]